MELPGMESIVKATALVLSAVPLTGEAIVIAGEIDVKLGSSAVSDWGLDPETELLAGTVALAMMLVMVVVMTIVLWPPASVACPLDMVLFTALLPVSGPIGLAVILGGPEI